MSQNKITTFIHNNLIATIIAALIIGGGLSALAFTAYNSGAKSVENSVTATTVSPQSFSSTIKSSSVASSIISSSSSQEAKKEVVKETVKETPKTLEVEKPKVIEEVKNVKIANPANVQAINKIDVTNLELTNVRVGGINPEGKITLSDSMGRIILFNPQDPYYPPTNYAGKASFSGSLKQRTDIGENVFEPIKGFLTDTIEPKIDDMTIINPDMNKTSTFRIGDPNKNYAMVAEGLVTGSKNFNNQDAGLPVYGYDYTGYEFYEFLTNDYKYIQVPLYMMKNVLICELYYHNCDDNRYIITATTDEIDIGLGLKKYKVIDDGNFRISNYSTTR